MKNLDVALFDVNYILKAIKTELKLIESDVNSMDKMTEGMNESLRMDFLSNFVDDYKKPKEDLFKELEQSGPFLLRELVKRAASKNAYGALDIGINIKECSCDNKELHKACEEKSD